MGRHSIRQVGRFYSLRVQFFLGLYMALLAIGTGIFIIDALVKVSGGGEVPLTVGMLSIGWLGLGLVIICFLIIGAGMRANRQPKLHKSAIVHYRTRLSQHVKLQARLMRRSTIENVNVEETKKEICKQELKTLLAREKDLQSALKYVANELDSENESEKLRIMGVPVDSRMLEGLVGLVSGLALTLWQIFSR